MKSWFNNNGNNNNNNNNQNNAVVSYNHGFGGGSGTQQPPPVVAVVKGQSLNPSSASPVVVVEGQPVIRTLPSPSFVNSTPTTTPTNNSNNKPYYSYENNTASSNVYAPYQAHGWRDDNDDDDGQQKSGGRRNNQGGACRDVFWGALFYLHLIAVVIAAIAYAPQAMDENGNYGNYGGDDDRRSRRLLGLISKRFLQEDEEQGGDNNDSGEIDLDIDPVALLAITGIAAVLGCGLSSLALSMMVRFAVSLIKTALVFNVAVFGIMALLSLATGAVAGVLPAAFMFAVSIYYTCMVWNRIPFAASNLVTAVTAVRANIGLVLYAYISLALLVGWSVLWTVSSASTIIVVGQCDEDGNCETRISTILIFLFMVSYYWTVQVIVNVVHVTTAGTVGTWWHHPNEASGCCSRAVRHSYVRSLTTSFGSICFGSLIVALIQAVKDIVHSMRDDGDSFVVCCAECIIGCIESLVEYFNKWAFVYVGLYGMSFIDAGSNVMTLFRNRGWTSIITDLMVDTVLFMVSTGVGALTALVAVLIGALCGLGEAGTLGAAAVLAFILGYGMSATLFSVVSSGVNTVVVCYAEAPNEFDTNHPMLSRQMRDSWRQAWPNDFGY